MQEIQPSLLKIYYYKQDESTFCRFKKTIRNIKRNWRCNCNSYRRNPFIGACRRIRKNFAELYGVKHCIISKWYWFVIYYNEMLGVGIGDEVITTAYSWISSSETISDRSQASICRYWRIFHDWCRQIGSAYHSTNQSNNSSSHSWSNVIWRQ
jgi:hypothetical protein